MIDFRKEKFDIIIQGGQSNAEGTGHGDVAKEYIPKENVLYLTAEKRVKATESGMEIEYADQPFLIDVARERPIDGKIYGDFSLTFAEGYVDSGMLAKDRKLLIIRAAVGGTGFQKGYWGLKDILYLKMLELIDYALKLNPDNRVVAFLWHQGEHDAFEGNTADNYYGQLTAMLRGVRAKCGKCVPFIAGDFVEDWKSKNFELCEPIVAVIKRVVEENEQCGFVETADLLSNNQKTGNGDDIHFCRQSLYALGRRYFAAYHALINS